MRKWAEVFQIQDMDSEQVAALDVTDEMDGGQAVMEDLKIIYPNCQYRFHTCYHDVGKSCISEDV